MPMLMRVVSRATQPHLPSLADALRPLLAVANAGSFHLRWQDGSVVIEQNSFQDVDTVAVDAAVANAPTHTDKLDAKSEVENLPLMLKAALLTLAGYSGKTPAQFRADVKSRVDVL